jgi:hypothetical protein
MRITFLFVLLTIISCQQKENKTSTESDFEFYPNIDTSAYKQRFLEGTRNNNKIFNLPDLLDGTKDSLEIRIWPWEAFDWSTNVLIFKYDGSEWAGYHYNSYTRFLSDQDSSLMIYSDAKRIGDNVFLVKQIIPACGWQKFSDSLEYFKIRTLPTQEWIKDFERKGILDGDAVSVEIATTKSYRRLGYSNPSSYEYKECKLVEGFMEMLRRQLGNDYLWPRVWLYPKKAN